MNDFTKTKISCISSHRIKIFEKEIRRYLSKKSKLFSIHEGTKIESNLLNLYMFKGTVDKIYKDYDENDFPFSLLLVYAQFFTLRNLKTDCFISPFEDDYDLYLDMVNNYDAVTLSVYDDNFLHKPESNYFDIFCAVNKTRNAIIPFRFSRDLGELYPNWFEEDKLEVHNKVEVGHDFNLLNKIKLVLS